MNEKFIQSYVKKLYDSLALQYSKEPTFEDLIKDCIYRMDLTKAEFLFSTLKDGWILNNFPEEDFKKIFKELFCDDRDYFYSELIIKLEEWNDLEMNLN